MDFNDINLNLSWGDLAKNTNYKEKEQKSYKDERFWTLTRDENGKGAAIIRLLPDKNSTPFVSLFNCGLREYNEADKKYYWYIRDLPSTIKAPDPLNELWSSLYEFGGAGIEEAKSFGRRETFITNIYVVKDPANPENNGKVFLWKFGKKLLDKFMTALNPSESERELGEKPKELFNPLKGNNIALKIKNVAGFPNYDDTSIQEESKVFKSEDEAKKAIFEKTYELKEFCNIDYFEPYEDLKKDLVNFCKKYRTKHMNQEDFDKIVSKVFKVEIGNSYTPQVSQKETKPESKPTQTEPKKEIKENDNIDDLLDELDI